MKSSFVITIVLSALFCVSAFGQTPRRTRTQVPVPSRRQAIKPPVQRKAVAPSTKKTTTAPTTKTTSQDVSASTAVEKSAFDKFYERLSMGYFGVFTSPNFKHATVNNAALSPEFGDTGRRCTKNCDTYAMNLWNQVNFAYDFGWTFKFVIIPRWTVHFANPRDMTRSVGEDRAMIGLEDALVGIAGTIYASEDKKFNWFVRPAMRLPTSHFSRTYNHPEFGRITNQLEAIHFLSYDFNPQWQLGLIMQQRIWVFENRYNPSRLRYYTAPYISYATSDTTKIQLYYQNMIENNKRWESINGLKPKYQDVYQDVMLSVAHDFTPRLNIMPYLGLFVNDVPLSMESAYVGAWISYRIK